MSPSDDQAVVLRRRAKMAQVYRAVFESDPGRQVLADISREGGLLEISFEPGDAHRTAFNEGRRSMVLYVMGQLRLKHEDIEKMARQPALPVFDDAVGE